MPRLALAAALVMPLALSPAAPALAQHAGHGQRPAANEPASTRELRAANDRMHREMNIRYSGNADRDFAAAPGGQGTRGAGRSRPVACG